MTTAADTLSYWVISLDPVALDLGFFKIRWYALAYIAGLVLGWQYINMLLRTDRLWTTRDAGPFPREWHALRLGKLPLKLPRFSYGEEVRKRHGVKPPATTTDIDDLLLWATLGVVLGGRLGYIFLYAMWYEQYRDYYLENPLRMLYMWEGGMAFHGGLIGVVLAIVLFSKARRLDMFRVGDLVAVATPIGLFFGRIANFVNGELWGKATNAPWGVVFLTNVVDSIPPGSRQVLGQAENPEGVIRSALASGDLSTLGVAAPVSSFVRHPSQLYEAALEGLVLFVILYIAITRFRILDRPGLATGIFLIGYALGRGSVEFWRENTAYVFSEDHWFTVGMLLSLPMIAAGCLFILRSYRAAPVRVTANAS